MNYKLKACTALSALALAGCGLLEQNNVVFTLNTPSAVEVSAATQDVAIKLSCDRMWNTSLAGGRWVRVLREDLAEDNVSGTVTVRVDYNPDEKARKDTVIFTCMDRTFQVEILQKERSSFLPQTSVVFGDKDAVEFSFTAVDTWKIASIEGLWFDIEPNEGQAGEAKVTFKVTENNGFIIDRTGTAALVSGHDRISIPVSQKVDRFTSETEYGIYYPDGRKAVYYPFTDQIARRYNDTYVSFRIMTPSTGAVTSFSGFSTDSREGDSLRLSVRGVAELSYDVTVLAIKDDTVWLKAADGTGFIIKI